MDGCAASEQSQQLTATTSSLIQSPQILASGTGITAQQLSTLDVGFSSQPVASMPGVVVISNNSVDRNINHSGGSSEKRMFLETVNADGHAYVITLHDNSAMYHTMPVAVDEVMSRDVGESQRVNDVSQAWFTSREDKSNFQSKGHVWKQGMWSKEEIELLEGNISKYCMENNIVDPAAVIFEMTKDERKDFYRLVAKGLNRPLFSVYRRVIRMYDNKNHIGKYTDDEMKKLKSLRIQYGNNWQVIGHELGRSASSIKDKCRLMKDNCNTGKWFPCEEDRLAEAVYELSRAVPGEMVTTGISWASVAKKVATRSEKQCRTKWLNYLNWKQVGGSDWTRDDDVVLITKVCSLDANDESEVDWVRLAEGWGSVRSPQWLRGKWWTLRRPLSSSHDSFKDICSQLFASHVVNVHNKAKSFNAVQDDHEDDDDNEQDEDDGVANSGLIVHDLSTHGVPMTMHQPVGLIPAPSILHVPLQVSNHGGHQIQNDLKPEQPMQTTFELIQPSGNPSTFYITHSPASSIPIATCTSTSTGQIIIQTISAEALQNANNLTMQMNMPSQFIISTSPSVASNVTKFSTSNLPTTIQFTGKLDEKDPHHCYSNGEHLIHSLELHGQMDGNVAADDKCSLQEQLSMGIDPFVHQDAELTCGDCATSPMDGHVELDHDGTEMTSHLISDEIGTTSDVENNSEIEDSLNGDAVDAT